MDLGNGILGCRKVLIQLDVVAGCRGDRPFGAKTLAGEVYHVLSASAGCCSTAFRSKMESSISAVSSSPSLSGSNG